MSLITQCSECATMFKVVPDQLRISEGLVRCGQCNAVFDANAHLQPSMTHKPPVLAISDVVPVSQSTTADSVATPHPQAPVPDEANQERNTKAVLLDVAKPEVDSQPSDFLHSSWGEPATGVQSQLSFMDKKQGKASFGDAIWVRALLFFCMLILIVTLALQLVMVNVNLIASRHPPLKPYLRTLCAVVRCELVGLRHIESVVIEQSSFAKLAPDVYSLNFTLKNAGDAEILLPALELTLTNSQDQARIRRVFASAELGISQKTLKPREEITSSLTLAVPAAQISTGVLGYRLLAFYL
jgi:predicted Zn finger-like uncharacterized protein